MIPGRAGALGWAWRGVPRLPNASESLACEMVRGRARVHWSQLRFCRWLFRTSGLEECETAAPPSTGPYSHLPKIEFCITYRAREPDRRLGPMKGWGANPPMANRRVLPGRRIFSYFLKLRCRSGAQSITASSRFDPCRHLLRHLQKPCLDQRKSSVPPENRVPFGRPGMKSAPTWATTVSPPPQQPKWPFIQPPARTAHFGAADWASDLYVEVDHGPGCLSWEQRCPPSVSASSDAASALVRPVVPEWCPASKGLWQHPSDRNQQPGDGRPGRSTHLSPEAACAWSKDRQDSPHTGTWWGQACPSRTESDHLFFVSPCVLQFETAPGPQHGTPHPTRDGLVEQNFRRAWQTRRYSLADLNGQTASNTIVAVANFTFSPGIAGSEPHRYLPSSDVEHADEAYIKGEASRLSRTGHNCSCVSFVHSAGIRFTCRCVGAPQRRSFEA